MPIDRRPFPKHGERFIAEAVLVSKTPPSSNGPSSVTRLARASYAAWLVAVLAVSLALTLDIVRYAVTHGPHHVRAQWFEHWAILAGSSMAAVALIGGLVVFGRDASWETVLTWPFLAGPAVALGYMFGLSGHTDGGGALCDAPKGGSCDTAWGLGAILLSFVASLVLGLLFVGTYAAKRLILRAISA